MAEPLVRLRLAGEPAIELPIERDPRPIACVAICGAHDGVDVEPLARALGGAPVARWRAIVRAREGAETIERDGEIVVRAAPSEMAQAIDALRSEGTAIAVGRAFVALRRPSLAILITGGAPPVQWDPEIRTLRDRFDLVIEEARPGLARELAKRLFPT